MKNKDILKKKLARKFNNEYSWRTKASKLINKYNFDDKVIVITGATNGIGLSTVKALTKTKAIIYVLVRNTALAQKRFLKCANVNIIKMDLDSFDSIFNVVSYFRVKNIKIDYLINNAGVMGKHFEVDSQQLEKHFKINYLSPFMLTNGLLPNLTPNSRIINLASVAHKWSRVHLEDPHFKKRKYNQKLGYGQSKTAIILFSSFLAKRLSNTNITVLSVHPGIIPFSNLWFPKNAILRIIVKSIISVLIFLQIHLLLNLLFCFINSNIVKNFKTNDQGASTTIYAMGESELSKHTGIYLEDCNAYPMMSEKIKRAYGLAPHANNENLAKELWRYTIKFFMNEPFFNSVFNS